MNKNTQGTAELKSTTLHNVHSVNFAVYIKLLIFRKLLNHGSFNFAVVLFCYYYFFLYKILIRLVFFPNYIALCELGKTTVLQNVFKRGRGKVLFFITEGSRLGPRLSGHAPNTVYLRRIMSLCNVKC